MNSEIQLRIVRTDMKPSLLTRAFHRLQERIRQPAVRRNIAKLIALMRSKVPTVASQGLSELHTQGITKFPQFLTEEKVLELKKTLELLPCFDPWAEELGEFSHENIPERTHVAQIRSAPSISKLHDLASDPRLVELAAGYFGCRPYLDSIQAWWSVSGHDQAEEAENFHRDNDSILFLKFFLYLTDVGELNGPHVFVVGSPASDKLLERRRLTDLEVESAHGMDIISMTGKAGDAFMEDTFGIHKGQLPKEGRRLLVQFRYSITETIFRSSVIVDGTQQHSSKDLISLIHAN